MALKPAVFIDKDGTLVHDLRYNVDPARIRLRDGAGEALARLRHAGFVLILVSNQPGVALGLFPESALAGVWAGIGEQLAGYGAALDAVYYCPHHPDGQVAAYASPCRCRKPRPGLLLRAAAELGIDLDNSWLIGDILDDIEAGRRAGCRTILLDVGSETEWQPGAWRRPHRLAAHWREAVAHVLADDPGASPCRSRSAPILPMARAPRPRTTAIGDAREDAATLSATPAAAAPAGRAA